MELTSLQNTNTLDPQVWIGDSRPWPDQVEPIQASTAAPRMKPKGGLWTSNLENRVEDTVTSPWLSFIKSSYPNCYEDPKAWILYPKADATVYTIDSHDDFEPLVEEDEQDFSIIKRQRIIWDRIFPEYDGLQLTEDGWSELWTSYRKGLSSWDCPSTLWSDWPFEAIEYVGSVTIPDTAP